ncbi:MAG: hypothetical protein ACR2HS_00135, partial [Gammaproteobacteria bacterium]
LLDSADESDYNNLISKIDDINKKMLNIAKASNPSEAGLAFGMRQIIVTLKNGLQVRRMELAQKAGRPLTESENEFISEQFAKEKKQLSEIHELEKKKLQENFDNELKKQKEEYENLLSKKEKLTISAEKAKKRQETLKQSGKDIADKLRNGKINGAKTDPFFVGYAFNVVIESIAKIVETGTSLGAAIDKYVTDNNISHKKQALENAILNHIEQLELREKSSEKLDEIIKNTNATSLNKEMTEKNTLQDFINSLLTTNDLKDVMDIAFNLLKQKLPNITKEQLKNAYLKKNEFAPITINNLKNEFNTNKRALKTLTQAELELGRLKAKKEKQQLNGENTDSTDKSILDVKNKINQAMIDAGYKKDTLPKFDKEQLNEVVN